MIDQSKFKEICPSLIQQLDSGVCASNVKTTKAPTTGEKHDDDEEPKWRRKLNSTVLPSILMSDVIYSRDLAFLESHDSA